MDSALSPLGLGLAAGTSGADREPLALNHLWR